MDLQAYRQALREADPPCVPYLGYYLTDLTFIEEGNPDLTVGLINIYKRQLVSEAILGMQQYQQIAYNFHPVPQIQQLFLIVSPQPPQTVWQLKTRTNASLTNFVLFFFFVVCSQKEMGQDEIKQIKESLYKRSLELEPRE
jgi:hypothetical protein